MFILMTFFATTLMNNWKNLFPNFALCFLLNVKISLYLQFLRLRSHGNWIWSSTKILIKQWKIKLYSKIVLSLFDHSSYRLKDFNGFSFLSLFSSCALKFFRTFFIPSKCKNKHKVMNLRNLFFNHRLAQQVAEECIKGEKERKTRNGGKSHWIRFWKSQR